MRRLDENLRAAFTRGHRTAVVFTQYADTMDYLRERLVQTYGEAVATYSGRGGERWDAASGTWRPTSKERVRALFREGKGVRILIGTDSLSEGLNLQTTRLLVNYDMPWNFMRVEQRIGRVDRIGGHPEVEIRNYFYADTVEQQVYQGIGRNVDWFQDVVGPAQPVLATVEDVIRQGAMATPGHARASAVETGQRRILRQIEEARQSALTLGEIEGAPDPGDEDGIGDPVMTLPEMERILTNHPRTRDHLRSRADHEGAYSLELPGLEPTVVTFSPGVADASAEPVVVLTYGTHELRALLEHADVGEVHLGPGGGLMVDGRELFSFDEIGRGSPPGGREPEDEG